MDIQLGYFRWKIHRWNEPPNPFRGRPDVALAWLRQFQGQGKVMSELRDLLNRSGVNRLDDQQVLNEVASRLSSGEFHACAECSHPYHVPEVAVVPPDPAAEALQQLDEMPPPPPPKVVADDGIVDAVQNGTTDTMLLASALQRAAKDGTPFCEECAKAAAKLAAQAKQNPPPKSTAQPPVASQPTTRPLEDATLPSDVDPVATSKGLKQAAQQGDPFSEEVRKS